MTPRVRALVLGIGLALTGAACAAHVFVPPSGAGEPAPEAATAWAEATRICRTAEIYSAELHVSGKVNGRGLGLRGSTLFGAVTSADQINLTLTAPFGRPGFVLAGTGSQATLLLKGENRYVTARAEEIVEALTGLKLGPRPLLAILTGCVTPDQTMTGGRRFAARLGITTADAEIYLRPGDGRWETYAGVVSGLIVDYRNIVNDWPHEVRLVSASAQARTVNLTLGMDQIGINVPLGGPSPFAVTLPPDAAPLTIEELRSIGPLGEKG